MAITCPNCGAEFDATLFEFGRRVHCGCGTIVEYPGTNLRQGHVIAQGGAATESCAASTGKQPQVLSERCWEVWRQGDDGNPFLVQRDLTEHEADEWVATLESPGHKQLYWTSRAKAV
jgi:hypothetical protein